MKAVKGRNPGKVKRPPVLIGQDESSGGACSQALRGTKQIAEGWLVLLIFHCGDGKLIQVERKKLQVL